MGTNITMMLSKLRQQPASITPGSDPFTITLQQGYLPYQLPLRRLPSAFDKLSEILDNMPILKEDGTPGLLATYQLGPLIDSGALLDLTDEIDNLVVDDKSKWDLAAVTAAFRDYSFVASAYLLEPCWKSWSNDLDGGYGLGRQVLPACIAGPLAKCAEILDIPAYMSYAASYALYNYHLVDPTKGHDDYRNLRLVRAFEKGLDSKSSEAGFILTHIHMVAQTGGLISGATKLLSTIDQARNINTSNAVSKKSSREPAKAALVEVLSAMEIIEQNMERMWANSQPKEYLSYRTFIYGITSQSMFPNGVIYEGQYNDKPQYFRGESGANDSIIPLLDHLCEIPMPENPLTEILREFRQYRPKPHREFLKFVMDKSAELGVREWLTSSGDAGLVLLYLRVLDHVRSFRWRHWQFTREYIIKHTSHPTATGGSPIITWLPNQLFAVMELMEDVCKGAGLWAVLEEGVWNGGGQGSSLSGTECVKLREIMDNVVSQKHRLQKEVAKYCQDRPQGAEVK